MCWERFIDQERALLPSESTADVLLQALLRDLAAEPEARVPADISVPAR